MTDIFGLGDTLAETFSTRKNLPDINIIPLGEKPVEERQEPALAPKIPNIQFDQTLPQNVKNSMAEAQDLERSQRMAERARTNELIGLVKNAQGVTDDSMQKIEDSQNHFLGEVIGLWNDDFDVSEQRRRIQEAVRNVQTKVSTNKLEAFKETLDLKDATSEYDSYVKTMALKTRNVALSTAQMNAVVQSNAARKAFQDFKFANADVADLKRRKANKDFDDVFSEQRIDAYFNKVEVGIMDMQAARLAFRDKQSDLGAKLEKRALQNLPKGYLQQQLDKSIEAGLSRVELGKDFFVAPSRVQEIIVQKNATGKALMEQNAEQAIKLAESNGDFNDAQQDTRMLSGDFLQGAPTQDLSAFNMNNTTDETIALIDYDSLHPSLANSYLQVMAHQANMNSKTSVTEQEIVIGQTLTKNLNDKIAELKKSQMDAQPDKESKASLQEWFNNKGRMTTSQNSATVLVKNAASMPNFQGDTALEQGWLQWQRNMIEDLEGKSVDFTEEGGIDTQALLQSMLSKSLRGKQTDQQQVLRSMTRIDSNNQSPLSMYTNTKSAEIMFQAITNLAAKHSDVKAVLLDANGDPSSEWMNEGGQSHVRVATLLAGMAFEATKTDKSLEPNYLNFALQEEINAIIAKNGKFWNQQANIESGSFMVNLFGNKMPSNLVDTAVGVSWAQHVNPAWEAVVNEPPPVDISAISLPKAL